MEDQKNTVTTVESTEQVKGHLVLDISKPTPVWLTWVFRIEFWATKGIITWLTAADILSPKTFQLTVLTLMIIDGAVWSAGRILGIAKPDDK